VNGRGRATALQRASSRRLHSFYFASDDFVGVSESLYVYRYRYVCAALPAGPFHSTPNRINGGRWRFYGILSLKSISTAAATEKTGGGIWLCFRAPESVDFGLEN